MEADASLQRGWLQAFQDAGAEGLDSCNGPRFLILISSVYCHGIYTGLYKN